MKPKDRDMVETRDGLIFCVVGYLHPPDRVTAYLKYVPTAEGKWSRGDTRYTRTLPYYHVTQVENTYSYLRENYPEYLYACPVRNITVSCVPMREVKRYYNPIDGLNSLLRRGPDDELEEKLTELAEYLHEQADVKGRIGVTGSLLTRSHNPAFSDFDMTVYGREESLRVKEAIVEPKNVDIRAPSDRELSAWVNQRGTKFPLNHNELGRIASKRWNYRFYRDTYFSLHPTRSDEEIKESYGDLTYRALGEVKGTATVSDASESIYLPAIYRVEDTKLETRDTEVAEIVSYEGIYGGLFEVGDKVKFGGLLERYEGKEEGSRVVLGGAGSTGGYVKWA